MAHVHKREAHSRRGWHTHVTPGMYTQHRQRGRNSNCAQNEPADRRTIGNTLYRLDVYLCCKSCSPQSHPVQNNEKFRKFTMCRRAERADKIKELLRYKSHRTGPLLSADEEWRSHTLMKGKLAIIGIRGGGEW